MKDWKVTPYTSLPDGSWIDQVPCGSMDRRMFLKCAALAGAAAAVGVPVLADRGREGAIFDDDEDEGGSVDYTWDFGIGSRTWKSNGSNEFFEAYGFEPGFELFEDAQAPDDVPELVR